MHWIGLIYVKKLLSIAINNWEAIKRFQYMYVCRGVQDSSKCKSPEEDPVQGWNMLWNKIWNLKIKSVQFIGGYFCNILNNDVTYTFSKQGKGT